MCRSFLMQSNVLAKKGSVNAKIILVHIKVKLCLCKLLRPGNATCSQRYPADVPVGAGQTPLESGEVHPEKSWPAVPVSFHQLEREQTGIYISSLQKAEVRREELQPQCRHFAADLARWGSGVAGSAAVPRSSSCHGAGLSREGLGGAQVGEDTQLSHTGIAPRYLSK